MFDSFFSLVRVKILCKDHTRIPKGRLYVFKAGVYKISFNLEGYVQADNSTDGDSGGVEELEEDHLLDDDDPKDNPKENDDDPKKDKDHEPQERESYLNHRINHREVIALLRVANRRKQCYCLRMIVSQLSRMP